MANYENGLETKARIINTCKELFYTKGFERTTFKEIGQTADVNQGLIVYYYKTKNILANTVFQDVMLEMMKQIESFFPEEDSLTKYFISDFLYFRLLYEDECFRDFIEKCCSNGIYNKGAAASQKEYQKYYDEIINYFEEEYIADLTLKEGLIAVYEGMKDTYSLYICQNYKKMTVDVAAINYITIYCHLLNIPQSVYGAKMLQSQLLANQAEISVDKFRFLMKL